MIINAVHQISNLADGVWLTDVTIATAGMALNVGGVARLPGQNGQQSYTLNASIPFTAPASGVDHHIVAITWAGALVVDPAPTRSDLAAHICWFDLPAGTTDLAQVTINQLVHIESLQQQSGGAA